MRAWGVVESDVVWYYGVGGRRLEAVQCVACSQRRPWVAVVTFAQRECKGVNKPQRTGW